MAAPGPATGARDRYAYLVVWSGQCAAVAGLTVVVPLLPFYLAGLGLPAADVAWWSAVTLAAPAVTQLVTAPLWGLVGDRYGHKAMVVRAHTGLALTLGLMALADTPGEFLACRLLQGACGGVVGATATYASSLTAAGRRGRALGGLFGATGAGSLLGPLLGSVLVGRLGFATLFGCVAVLLGVSAVLALTTLPRPPVPAAPPRRAGSPARRRPTAPTRTRLRDVVTQLLRDRRSRTLLLAGLLAQAAAYALVVVFAPQVERVAGSVAAATVWVGGLQAATWAASLAGGPWWGRRNDRRPAHLGFATAALGCGAAVALQAAPATPELLLPLRLAQGFCFAALAQSVLYVVCAVMPAHGRGAALGATSGVLDLGQVLGPFLGALAASALPAPAAFAAIGGLLGLAAGCALLGPRRARHAPEPRLARTVPVPTEVKP